MSQFLVPFLRAAAQAAVAFVAAFLLVHFGLSVDPATQAELVGLLAAVLTGLVAKGQQYLERRYPQLGVLLHSPSYMQGLNELRLAASKMKYPVNVQPLGPGQAAPAENPPVTPPSA